MATSAKSSGKLVIAAALNEPASNSSTSAVNSKTIDLPEAPPVISSDAIRRHRMHKSSFISATGVKLLLSSVERFDRLGLFLMLHLIPYRHFLFAPFCG